MRDASPASDDILGWLRNAGPGDRHDVTLSIEPYWLGANAPAMQFAVRLARAATTTIAEFVSTRGDAVSIDLTEPWPLVPVRVAKPWGEEWWFTGIEARGVSGVGQADATVPLPALLALAPDWLCGGRREPPILAKILAPHADPLFGELYLEVHAEKQEVYVVTHVDPAVWPDGLGAIRLGKRALTADPTARQAFIERLRTLRDAQAEIVAIEDHQRALHGVGSHAVLELAQARALRASVPAPLRERHAEAKHAVDRLLALHPLRRGDSIAIPRGVPHALQGGVRVIEFQTPHYERHILAFNQKVLTEPAWAIDEGVAALRTADPMADRNLATSPPALSDHQPAATPAAQVQRIVDFPEFEVLRLTLTNSAASAWRPPPADYAIAIGVTGEVEIGNRLLGPECGCFVPSPALTRPVRVVGTTTATLLWAMPRQRPGP